MKELREIKRNYNARQNGICNIICFDSVTMHKSKKLKPLTVTVRRVNSWDRDF